MINVESSKQENNRFGIPPFIHLGLIIPWFCNTFMKHGGIPVLAAKFNLEKNVNFQVNLQKCKFSKNKNF